MTAYEQARAGLRLRPQRWLVTGVAGFIGSHLLESLLKLDQEVVGLDNYVDRLCAEHRPGEGGGRRSGVAQLHAHRRRHTESRGLQARLPECGRRAASGGAGVGAAFHRRSAGDPRRRTSPASSTCCSPPATQVSGAFIYAASSSTYGDHPGLPKVENAIGRPLSPYAVTKYANELYADVFARCYGIEYIGLRYFNIFGRAAGPRWRLCRRDPDVDQRSSSAATPVYINGDGDTSRDFCYVQNAVQANLLAAIDGRPVPR